VIHRSPDPADTSPPPRRPQVIPMLRGPLPLPPLSRSQRVIAALAHLFAVIPIWGLAAAFWIWHTRRDEHPELRFQALQAMMLQGIGLLLTVFYAVAQLFFRLVAVLDVTLSETLCRFNTLVWEASLILLALMALWAVVAIRQRGRFEYPVVGPVLRREVLRAEAEEMAALEH
jgi:uncharacterized Tic20 family protein